MHGEGGQATVEWVALVLLAALILTATAALSSPAADRDLGDLVAKRIARTPSELVGGRSGLVGGRSDLVAGRSDLAAGRSGAAPAPGALAAAPPVRAPRALRARARARGATPRASRVRDALRRLRGVGRVARHAWIGCLGYRRWRYELEHPSAPNEALPLGEALDIANACLNPYDYLLED